MRRLGIALGLAPALLGLGLLGSRVARAGNEAHPRTPVLWPQAECGRVIDRSVEPIAHFDYSIPFEDLLLGPDELADSRTQQFFALCRQRPFSELLPNWISDDDLARATQAGLIVAGSVPASEVLDSSATWAGCSLRVSADDERRAISFAAADAGFDWDLAGVPVGVWQLAGYTFEPALNLWRTRPGFVKIVDDPSDPDQDLPAAAIASTEGYWSTSTPNSLELCVDLITPATAFVEWSPFAPELDWQPLGQQTIEQDGALTMMVEGPGVPLVQRTEGLLRVRVVDALGREVIAEHTDTILFEYCNGNCEPSSGDESSGDEASADDLFADDPRHACAYAQTPPGSGSPLAWLLLVIAGLARRPRRSDRAI